MRKGYITILFSAFIGISMSLIITMFYGIRESAIRMKAVSVADIAMTSAFAEYNRELWNQYGLIFVDSSYMTKAHSLVLSEQHVKEFANKNFNECEFFTRVLSVLRFNFRYVFIIICDIAYGVEGVTKIIKKL